VRLSTVSAAVVHNLPAASTRFMGAAEALGEKMGKTLPIAVPDEFEHATQRAREALGEETYAAAWAFGRAMSMDDAVAYALEGG
jgi:hypothetical protein